MPLQTDQNMRGEGSLGMGNETMDEGMHQEADGQGMATGHTIHVSRKDFPDCKPGDRYTFEAGEEDGDGDIAFKLVDHQQAGKEDGRSWEDRFRQDMSPRTDAQPQTPEDTY